jgi:serine/threonine protein kinase
LDRVKKILGEFSKDSVGTPSITNANEQFLAPEVLKFFKGKPVEEFGCATDIYAFGILISCFLSKKSDPYQQYKYQAMSELKKDLMDLIIDGYAKPFVPTENYAGDFLLSCLYVISVWCVSNNVTERPKMSILFALCNALRVVSQCTWKEIDLDEDTIKDLEVTYQWYQDNEVVKRNIGLRSFGMALCGFLLSKYDKERRTKYGDTCFIYKMIGQPYFPNMTCF